MRDLLLNLDWAAVARARPDPKNLLTKLFSVAKALTQKAGSAIRTALKRLGGFASQLWDFLSKLFKAVGIKLANYSAMQFFQDIQYGVTLAVEGLGSVSRHLLRLMGRGLRIIGHGIQRMLRAVVSFVGNSTGLFFTKVADALRGLGSGGVAIARSVTKFTLSFIFTIKDMAEGVILLGTDSDIFAYTKRMGQAIANRVQKLLQKVKNFVLSTKKATLLKAVAVVGLIAILATGGAIIPSVAAILSAATATMSWAASLAVSIWTNPLPYLKSMLGYVGKFAMSYLVSTASKAVASEVGLSKDDFQDARKKINPIAVKLSKSPGVPREARTRLRKINKFSDTFDRRIKLHRVNYYRKIMRGNFRAALRTASLSSELFIRRIFNETVDNAQHKQLLDEYTKLKTGFSLDDYMTQQETITNLMMYQIMRTLRQVSESETAPPGLEDDLAFAKQWSRATKVEGRIGDDKLEEVWKKMTLSDDDQLPKSYRGLVEVKKRIEAYFRDMRRGFPTDKNIEIIQMATGLGASDLDRIQTFFKQSVDLAQKSILGAINLRMVSVGEKSFLVRNRFVMSAGIVAGYYLLPMLYARIVPDNMLTTAEDFSNSDLANKISTYGTDVSYAPQFKKAFGQRLKESAQENREVSLFDVHNELEYIPTSMTMPQSLMQKKSLDDVVEWYDKHITPWKKGMFFMPAEAKTDEAKVAALAADANALQVKIRSQLRELQERLIWGGKLPKRFQNAFQRVFGLKGTGDVQYNEEERDALSELRDVAKKDVFKAKEMFATARADLIARYTPSMVTIIALFGFIDFTLKAISGETGNVDMKVLLKESTKILSSLTAFIGTQGESVDKYMTEAAKARWEGYLQYFGWAGTIISVLMIFSPWGFAKLAWDWMLTLREKNIPLPFGVAGSSNDKDAQKVINELEKKTKKLEKENIELRDQATKAVSKSQPKQSPTTQLKLGKTGKRAGKRPVRTRTT